MRRHFSLIFYHLVIGAIVASLSIFSSGNGYEIVSETGDYAVTTVSSDVSSALLEELASTMRPLSDNITCYCSPENTTVACNDTDVEPLQMSSLIPNNTQFLFINYNRITYDHIGQGNFSRTKNITEIILRNCGVAEILPASFRTLNELKHFELSENGRRVVLRDDVFAGSELDSVFLHKLYGGLSIAANSFRDALIRVLMMVRCQLREIPEINYKSLGNSLSTIYFSQNDIAMVNSWTFNNLHSLKRLFLDNNKIKDVRPNAFANTNLELLDLSQNPGIRFYRSSFKDASIKKLLLSDCGITQLDYGVLEPLRGSLIELDLSSNFIRKIGIGTFVGLQQLTDLDLSNNSYMAIYPKAFFQIPLLQRLDLSDCKNLKINKGAFCNAVVQELYLARSTGLTDYNYPSFLSPLLTPVEESPQENPISNLRILDASQCGVRNIAKNDYWMMALSMISDKIYLNGNQISCSNPQVILILSKYQDKLVDICRDYKYIDFDTYIAKSHSELSYNEDFGTTAVAEECDEAVISDESLLYPPDDTDVTQTKSDSKQLGSKAVHVVYSIKSFFVLVILQICR